VQTPYPEPGVFIFQHYSLFHADFNENLTGKGFNNREKFQINRVKIHGAKACRHLFFY